VSELYRPDWSVFNDNYLKLIDLWNRKMVSR
jgi:hypothetical protein